MKKKQSESTQYVQPKVEVLQVNVEKGYASSFGTGGSGENSVTDGEYSWADEIEL